jgi:hypothetical protein
VPLLFAGGFLPCAGQERLMYFKPDSRDIVSFGRVDFPVLRKSVEIIEHLSNGQIFDF